MDYVPSGLISIAVVILGAMWTHTARVLKNGRSDSTTDLGKLIADGFESNAISHALQVESNRQLTAVLAQMTARLERMAETLSLSCQSLGDVKKTVNDIDRSLMR